MRKKIVNYSILGLVFVLPLLFLPFMVDFYTMPKNFLLIFASITLFCLWFAQKIISRDFKLNPSSFDLPVLLFCVTTILSNVIVSANKVESLLSPGGTGTIIALTLLYFVIANLQLTTYNLQLPLLASAAVLGLLALYQFSGVSKDFLPYPFLQSKAWTPAGSLLALASFLLVGLVLGVSWLRNRTYMTYKTSNMANSKTEPSTADLGLTISSPRNRLSLSEQAKPEDRSDLQQVGPEGKPALSNLARFLLLIAVALILLGLGVSLYQLFNGQRLTLLPVSSGWSIAVEGFKTLKTGFFGVGPGNFITAFTRWRPLSFNKTDFFNVRFGNSSNHYFQLLTETGLLGLMAFLFLAYQILTHRYTLHAARCTLRAILLLYLFMPANLLLQMAFFVLLGVEASQAKEKILLSQKTFKKFPPALKSKLWAGVPLILEIIFLYFFVQVVSAEVTYKKALDQVAQGQGGRAYNLLIEAIGKNPYRESFRVSYSQLNLALASNWAAQEELTDQDRATITQLISQAIREAKAAVTLNPLSATNWQNLAQIYRSVINIAQGADAWAVSAYNQAISLDPLNPLLRLDLGGVFYAYQNFEEAEKIFERAVALKGDWANSRYNLAAALKAQDKNVRALRQMQTALSLVEPDSNDFEKLSAEIEELRKKMAPESEVASPSGELETLTPPKEAPEGIKPKIELGEEAKPEVSPSPSPSPTVTPTPRAGILLSPSPTKLP